eukprot:tig00000984_g5992.t1
MAALERELPPPVKRGDKVGIVSTSSPIDPKLLEQGCAVLRSWGLEPVVYPHALNRWGYLAGEDHERARDLLDAFTDEEIKAVLCARGGYGCARLLELLPLEAGPGIPRKRFTGFSDVTALHGVFPFVTFHAPMVATGIFCEGTAESVERLRLALFGEAAAAEGPGEPLMPPIPGRVLQRGAQAVTVAPVVGGNLALLAALAGTRWQTQAAGCILLLEDIDEPPYRLDRMLAQLRLSGLLDGVVGVVLGDFTFSRRSAEDAAADLYRDQYASYPREDFWRERLGLARLRAGALPVLAEVPVGHIRNNFTVPIGLPLALDTGAGILRLPTRAELAAFRAASSR